VEAIAYYFSAGIW